MDLDIMPLSAVQTRVTLPYTLVPYIEQLLITGSMLVNPYAAFDPIPAIVTLNPAIDRWTENQTQWTSDVTNRVTSGWGNMSNTTSSTSTETVNSSTSDIEFLQQITVLYTLDGFAPNEKLASLTFDGIELPVNDTIKTNANGIYEGFFTVPEGVRAGSKTVLEPEAKNTNRLNRLELEFIKFAGGTSSNGGDVNSGYYDEDGTYIGPIAVGNDIMGLTKAGVMYYLKMSKSTLKASNSVNTYTAKTMK